MLTNFVIGTFKVAVGVGGAILLGLSGVGDHMPDLFGVVNFDPSEIQKYLDDGIKKFMSEGY